MGQLETNREWLRWGETDPLWGVATWKDRGRKGSNPWTDEAFYALGCSDWRDIESHWRPYGFDPRIVVDLGCGAGRLTAPIATVGGHVHGVDISPAMLAYASSHVKASNVSWHVGDGTTIPLPGESATALVSFHVLQHLPSTADGIALLGECVRVLKPGGTLCVHLPVFSLPRNGAARIARRLLNAWATLGRTRSRVRRTLLRFGGSPFLHGVSYEIEPTLRHLAALGCKRVELSVFATTINGGYHSCLLATK